MDPGPSDVSVPASTLHALARELGPREAPGPLAYWALGLQTAVGERVGVEAGLLTSAAWMPAPMEKEVSGVKG